VEGEGPGAGTQRDEREVGHVVEEAAGGQRFQSGRLAPQPGDEVHGDGRVLREDAEFAEACGSVPRQQPDARLDGGPYGVRWRLGVLARRGAAARQRVDGGGARGVQPAEHLCGRLGGRAAEFGVGGEDAVGEAEQQRPVPARVQQPPCQGGVQGGQPPAQHLPGLRGRHPVDPYA
jgi:hypothetical protein